MLHIPITTLALAAAAFATTGCGQSSKTAGSATQRTAASASVVSPSVVPTFRSTPPLTHAALIARVNTICKRVIAQRNAITSQLHTEEDFAQHIPQFAAYEQAGLAELRSLTPPSSLTATWRRIGAIAATLESETGKWGGLVKEKRVKLAYSQVYPNMVSLDVKITHALRRKGFKDCKEF